MGVVSPLGVTSALGAMEETMKTAGPTLGACLASLALLALPAVALAQGKPRTANEVPTDCARLSSQQAKDDCARAYNQKNPPGAQGATQGTGVGKGQGQGQGIGQGSGQGATHGVGQGNKKPK